MAVALAAAGDALYAGHARTAAAKVAAVLTGTGGDPDTAARIRVTPSPPPGLADRRRRRAGGRRGPGGRAVVPRREGDEPPPGRVPWPTGASKTGTSRAGAGCGTRALFRLDRIDTIEVLAERIVDRDLDEVLGWVPGRPERPSLLPWSDRDTRVEAARASG